MDSETKTRDQPHVVCIPAGAQSHIKVMLKLAKLLHTKGFHITFINTEFNHKRCLQSNGPNSLTGLPDFRFETISDGLPVSDSDTTQDVPTVCESLTNTLLGSLRRLIEKLNGGDGSLPPVSWIVADGFMPFSTSVGKEFGIPVTILFTISACAFMRLVQHSVLKEKGFVPMKDESYLTNGYLNTIIDWIPRIKEIRLKDLPSSIRTVDPNDFMFNFCMEAAQRSFKSSSIIIHTFDALEQDVLNALSSMLSPKIYTIGPIEFLVNQLPKDPLPLLGYSLWKKDTECLKWLASKPPNSVIYVNFGSLIVLTQQQLVEFGWGLANSKHSFLWIIRPDLVQDASAILPPEFLSEVEERCFITSWCEQEKVLNYPAIGVFLTHNGWSSTIESLSAGKPMICSPFYGDQFTNGKYCCNEWRVGKEIEIEFTRDQVEKVVREMMEEENGKKMKIKAMEWQKLAQEATSLSGSSSLNLNHLVNDMLVSNFF